MQSKNIQEMRENAKLYKAELMKMLLGSSPEVFVLPGGQSVTSAEPSILNFPKNQNILGFGYGTKTSNGELLDDQEAVLVYVRAKLSKNQISTTETIPSTVNGLPTDIVPVGEIVAYRPIKCGVSIAHSNVTAGTLGCVVSKKDSTSRFILSNNHVLANSNNANLGDNIIEPGPADGGTSPIARLSDFEPIKFGAEVNTFDAAIATLINPSDVSPEIHSIGQIAASSKLGALHMSVRKRGRTTFHTVGVITDISADFVIRYGNQFASFEDQISIAGVQGPFAQPGDSGSLIVDAVTREPVALLFGGSSTRTFASPIDQILERFQVNIVVS